MGRLIHQELSNQVLAAAFAVYKSLGPGLLESAYEGAFCIEFKYRNLLVERQRVYPVFHRNELAGGYLAELVVENSFVLELKSVVQLNQVMEAQIINYLRLSGLRIGYLLNFLNNSVQRKRFVV
jgi:GxxExxY protein